MKTRKGKRFLSALLAAIMVLTALPLTALAEGPTPAKSDALITLDNAINAYESAMDGKIYADMVTNLERVADHSTNIAYRVLEAGIYN